MCQKRSQQGRRAAWLNTELWLQLGEKKRVYHLGKNGQAILEGYKDFMSLRREIIRRAEVQVELHLVTAMKDKSIFKNTSAIKEGLWKISILYWIQR